MVYHYKRKTERGMSWTGEDMAAAIDCVNQKELSIHKAALRFNITYSTLQKHVKKNTSKKSLGRFKPVFSEEEENEFVEHIKALDGRFYGLTRKDLCELAYQYAEKNKIQHPFTNDIAGEQWFTNFMKRHPQLSLRQPEPTSIARARGFNKPQVELFFKNLKTVMDKYNIAMDNIYNVDETGIQTSAKKPPRVISIAGKKQVGSISSAERGTLITSLFCCSATGKFIPPTLIFPRKKRNPRYLNGTPPGTLDLVTDNGWISSEAFLKWMEFFVASVRPTKEHKCLLIMDNHSTHRCMMVLDYASENNVVILTVPPHTTHKLQPLDVAVYGPFSKYFQVEMDKWQKTHPGQHVTFFEIGQIFAPAYLKAAVPNNAIKGFRKTGISDCNMDVFEDYDFLPAQVTDIENMVANNAVMAPISDAPSCSTASCSLSVDLPPTSQNNVILNVDKTKELLKCKNTFESNSATSLPNFNDFNINLPSSSNLIPYFPLNPNLLAPVNKPADNKKIKIIDIQVIPKCTQRVQKTTRKCQKSEILTSTPVKEELRNKVSSAKKQAVKRKIGVTSGVPKLKMPKPPLEEKNPEENSVPCILCWDIFGNSKPGEDWIKCNICSRWAHKLCADYNSGVFICDHCRESVLKSRK